MSKTHTDVWNDHAGFIVHRATEIHKQHPHTLELDEKISIAWLSAQKANETFDPTLGYTWTTYSGKAINRALYKEINKEIQVRNNIQYLGSTVDEENHSAIELELYKNQMAIEEKYVRFHLIRKAKDGLLIWKKYVKGISLKDLAEKEGYSRSKLCQRIKKFQKKYY